MARRLEKLEELKHSLEKNYSIHCKTIAADLSNINNIEHMFRESIQNEELRGDNVSLTVFSPGGIATEMTHSSGLAAQFEGSAVLQSPEQCAAEAIQAMESRRALYVPGWVNRLQVFGARLLPRSLLIFFAGKLYRKALKAKRNSQ